jgi:hypothetical protein
MEGITAPPLHLHDAEGESVMPLLFHNGEGKTLECRSVTMITWITALSAMSVWRGEVA